jgi:pimeloyl-ACP methyl ester carboxylesterase
VVISHGWPGSIVEFHKVIEPLTNPTAHGGDAADAFHVVCPSLPGFGFSEKPSRSGWNAPRIARAWSDLMLRLGYKQYVAQGGDWGAAVTTCIGIQDTTNCKGIHLNLPIVAPDPATSNDLTEKENSAIAALRYYNDWESGYAKQQSTRPQTLGYGLADSPAGQLTWILEKFWAWTDCDGHPENVLTRDEMLDNVMLYWLPGTAASSARLYWESMETFRSTVPITIPVGCSIFPKEIFRTSRRWAEKRFANIIYFNEVEKGGHFAAFEQPEIFVREVRTCFKGLR